MRNFWLLLVIQAFFSLPALAAPTVTGVSPPAAAVGVPTSTTVNATFSTAIDPASITANGFTLEKRVGAVAIAAGTYHTLALKGDGTVVSWGLQYPSMVVPEGLRDVVAIAAGVYHSMALKADGTVVVWGENAEGQLTIPEGLVNVVAIAAGPYHNVALKADGTVVAWGHNGMGQTAVPAGLSGVKAIATGDYHTVAVREEGTVVAWGDNTYGQTTVPANLFGVVAVAAGRDHTLALKSDGTVVAWGVDGEVTAVPPGLSDVVAIAAGTIHSVALKADGTVVAWGFDGEGWTTVPEGLDDVVAISTQFGHTVALKGDGSVVAWGLNDHWQTTVPERLAGVVDITMANADDFIALKADGTITTWGDNVGVPAELTGMTAIGGGSGPAFALKSDGTVAVVAPSWSAYDPVNVPEGLSGVVDLASRWGQVLAVKDDGTIVAWGSPNDLTGWSVVPQGLSGIVDIAAGNFYSPEVPGAAGHALALKDDGTVVAWGDNPYGQINTGGLTNVVAVAAGDTHSVALKGDGTVIAWGDNQYGQTAVPAGLAGVVAIAAAHRHTLALKGDGTVVAWGAPEFGVLNVPAGLTDVVAIAAGGFHSMALKGDGTVVTWGENSYYRRQQPVAPYFSPVAATVTYDEATLSATLTPNEPLEPQAVYRATLFGRSTDGTPMAGSQSWTLTPGATLTAYLVRPQTGLHGKVTPTIAQLVPAGTTATFTLTPDPGYTIESVTGCNGVLSDTTYTTGSIDSACTVQVAFSSPLAKPLALTVPAASNPGEGYTVSWTASPTPGVSYLLEEATNRSFTAGLRIAYSGTELTAAVAGKNIATAKTYYYRVKATKEGYPDSAWVVTTNGTACVANTAASPATLTVPTTDADRTYKVTWGASASTGVTYVLQESTSSDFSTDLQTLYSGSKLSYIVTDRNFATRYYYRVKATKPNFTDSAWRVAANSCDLPVAPAGLITAPNADADGSYSVSWVASATPGVTYTLSEASDSAFTVGLRKVYEGPDLNVNVTGRAQGKTYYYRVRANLAGLPSSAWKIRLKGCAVPGSTIVATPGVPLVPTTDSDGNFTISWTPSATADVTYELQQATNSAFNVGAFIAYRGTATTVDLTGRAAGKTFYYRVRAIKAGLEDSGFRAGANGCLVGP